MHLSDENKEILNVKELKLHFDTDDGLLKALDGVSFTLKKGKVLGIVGESGSGKTLTSRVILGIEPANAKRSGEINYRDFKRQETTDLLSLERDSPVIRRIRGGKISMIFQEPMTAFSPYYSIGNQIIEGIYLHKTKDKKQAKQIALAMMEKVGISNSAVRFNQYPFEFSGGMRQRAMIAMALACQPDILIADEPTTAIDVTIQAQIIELMKELQQDMGMSILFITHNLGVISDICDEVIVMYLGEIVEYGPVNEIFNNPRHPYTKGLLKSVPRMGDTNKTKLETIQGVVPVPINLPARCKFYDRCEVRIDGLCADKLVAMQTVGVGHQVRCFHYLEGSETYKKESGVAE